jgi:hypothetical protein
MKHSDAVDLLAPYFPRSASQRYRVRSDYIATMWRHERLTHPTETVELIQRELNSAITDEAKIAGILDILAKSTLAGEKAD